MYVTIDASLAEAHLCWLGIVNWGIVEVAQAPHFWAAEMDVAIQAVRAGLPTREAMAAEPAMAAAQAAYRVFGVNPKRYPPASEALIKRLLDGRSLPSVNTLIDINNLLSIRIRSPVGSYSVEPIRGSVIYRRGQAGETFVSIANEPFNVTGLPVLADDIGAFGSATRDSMRTRIVNGSITVISVIMTFINPFSSGIVDEVSHCLDLATKKGVGRISDITWIASE